MQRGFGSQEVSGEAGTLVPRDSLIDERHLASGSGLAALASFHFLPLKLLVQFLAASLQMGPCPSHGSSAGDPAACRGWGSEQTPVYRKWSLALALNPFVRFFSLLIQCIRMGRDPAQGAGEGEKQLAGHRLQVGQGESWGLCSGARAGAEPPPHCRKGL